jgi:hypothetical protein
MFRIFTTNLYFRNAVEYYPYQNILLEISKHQNTMSKMPSFILSHQPYEEWCLSWMYYTWRWMWYTAFYWYQICSNDANQIGLDHAWLEGIQQAAIWHIVDPLFGSNYFMSLLRFIVKINTTKRTSYMSTHFTGLQIVLFLNGWDVIHIGFILKKIQHYTICFRLCS